MGVSQLGIASSFTSTCLLCPVCCIYRSIYNFIYVTHQLQGKYVPMDMCPVSEDYFCSSSKGSVASIPRFLNFCIETRGIFHWNIRLFSCGLQENPGLDSILVPSQQVPFQKKKLSVCVLHEKQIKRKCVLQSSIVDFSPILLLYSKATHSHQIRLL